MRSILKYDLLHSRKKKGKIFMKSGRKILSLSIAYAILIVSLFLSVNSSIAGQGGEQDKRKLTKIQTVSIDVGKTKNAVEVLYLDLPWGEKTFGYLEQGGNDYYSTRTWPFAHLKLAVRAKYDGKVLAPGNYMMIITPKNDPRVPQMTLSIASFHPDQKQGTFLVPGDIFTETPRNVVLIDKKPVSFEKGAPMADYLKIDLEKVESDAAVDLKVHYGDRSLTKKLVLF